MNFSVTGLGAIIIMIAVFIDIIYNIFRLGQYLIKQWSNITNDPMIKANSEMIQEMQYLIKHKEDIKEVVKFSNALIYAFEKGYLFNWKTQVNYK